MDLLYIRTAKTASSTVNAWIGPKTGVTFNQRFLTEPPNDIKVAKAIEYGHYLFTTIRNPFTRALSCWKQAMRICWIGKDVSFEDFLDINFHKILHPHYMTHTIPLADYLKNYLGRLDKIAKLETIQEDMDDICKTLNLEKSKVRHDRLGKYDHEECLKFYNNPKIVDKVRKVYAVDFEAFNYSKDISTIS